jgi:outer membrane lipoprotein-sorting protein
MRRIIALVLATLIAILSGSAGICAGPNGDLDTILSNMQVSAQKIHSIHANIHQETRFGSIGGFEKYDGEIWFKHVGLHHDQMRMKYFSGKDVTTDLWVNGDNIVFYQPRIKQAIKTTRGKQAGKKSEYGVIATPYVSVPDLKTQYNVVYVKDEAVGSNRTAVLELTPKAKSDVTKVVLWVDRSSWLPVQYQVTRTNTDVLTYTLSNTKRDEKIEAKVFEANLPAGIKVIEQ